MSKIDWDRPLEAYHEDGRVMEITCAQPSGNEQWPLCGVADGKHIFTGPLGVSRSAYGDMPGWDVRNVTEPKADAFDTAFREGSTDIPQWAWDRMKAEYIEKDGMAASFARYVMTKEEAREAAAEHFARRMGGTVQEHLDVLADDLFIVQAMQSLINSTIERCAAVADGELVHIFEDTPDETDAICNATVREIARGIRQMKGSTNV